MEKKKEISVIKIILRVIAITGVISVAVLAPNALQILKPLMKDKKKYNPKWYIKKTIHTLKDNGLIVFEQKNNRQVVRLTEKGMDRLSRYKLNELNFKKPRKWDGKWRIIIFDIKETRRRTRNTLRMTLVNFGFVKLQQSVWVFPYDCEELVILLKSDFRIGKGVLYMLVDKLENDHWLKKEFDLV
jgi:DNA-binding transcriptional regulator PaaX